MWRQILAGLVLGAAAAGSVSCDRAAGPRQSVAIAAAADLRYALDEIVDAFEVGNPDVEVTVSYGSSGSFYAQLRNGAPFDVFLSADVEYTRQLDDRGLTVPGSNFTYAIGRIAVWAPGRSGLPVETLGLQALADPGVTHVAIANPQHAPYGRAAVAALEAAGLLDAVKPKFVLGENVSQTLQFVQSGSAEAGIIALSLALAPPVKDAGQYWLVPASMHAPIEQGGTIMRTAADVESARRFAAFVGGEHARAILRRYGFTVSSN